MEEVALKGKHVVVWAAEGWLERFLQWTTIEEETWRGTQWRIRGVCEGECSGVGIWIRISVLEEKAGAGWDIEIPSGKSVVWLVPWRSIITVAVYENGVGDKEVEERRIGFTRRSIGVRGAG